VIGYITLKDIYCFSFLRLVTIPCPQFWNKV